MTIDGQVHGTVTRTDGGSTSPVYVTAIFSGGPVESQRVRGGQYALPLLARRCADGTHWVRFGLSAVGFATGITPTGPDVQKDIGAGEVPGSVPDLPGCLLVLGVIKGRVLVHGGPAAANTVVTSSGPPSSPSLDQATTTDNRGA